jgi:hypothetical protein
MQVNVAPCLNTRHDGHSQGFVAGVHAARFHGLDGKLAGAQAVWRLLQCFAADLKQVLAGRTTANRDGWQIER